MRRRPGSHLILVSVLFWVLAGGGFLLYLAQENDTAPSGDGGPDTQRLAVQYLEAALPVISRGTPRARPVSGPGEKAAPDGGSRNKEDAQGASDSGERRQAGQQEKEGISPQLKGLIAKAFPILDTGAGGQKAGDGATGGERAEGTGGEGNSQGREGQGLGRGFATDEGQLPAAKKEALAKEEAVSQPEGEEAQVPVLDTQESKKPQVLIYHTHATESYQPVSIGNFHSVEERGTVREVGNELAKALEEKGISVIHDKTLHDHPSYNQSYGRSLQTVESYLKKNPSIKIVIDLHRDAASYSGNVGKTVNIKGNKAATYSLVIGRGNANVEKLRLFANRINGEAERLYPGLAHKIIEKEYRFNEYVCDQYLLLEVGNNENTIDQVKLTGKYFADILAAYIRNYSH